MPRSEFDALMAEALKPRQQRTPPAGEPEP